MLTRVGGLAVVASLVVTGCAAGDVRRDQAESLRDACVSMLERAYPDAPVGAAVVGEPARDLRPWTLPEGSSADRRAVDVLLANCTPLRRPQPANRRPVGR